VKTQRGHLASPEIPSVTRIDLEFDTTPERGAPLGDIAATLVSVNDLLRDLAAIIAAPSGPEYREIQVVAIDMHSPLTVTLSLRGIADEAVKAFQEICRDVIVNRERPRDVDVFVQSALTDAEAARLRGHIATLQNADVPLQRVSVKS
jgi:hypothetical protein